MQRISKNLRHSSFGSARIAPAFIIVTLLLNVAGCGKKGCGGDESAEQGAAEEHDPAAEIERMASTHEITDPQHPVGVLLAQIPADAGSLVLVRSWTEFLTPVGPLVDRAESYVGDVSEALVQLREQLGVDVRRPQDLTNVGIAPHGAMAFYIQNNAGIMATQTTDGALLREHLQSMLSQSPWRYDREPVVEEQAGYTITQFGSSNRETWDAALIVRGTHARLAMRQSTDPLPIEQLLQGVETSVRESEAFNETWSELNDHHIIVWANADDVADVATRAIQLPAIAGFSMQDVVEAASSAALGISLADERIDTELFVATKDTDAARELERQLTLDDQRINFSTLGHDEAYAIGRVQGPLDIAFRQTLARLGGLSMDATDEELRAVIGRSFESTLTGALGDEAAFAATRARIFTLTSILRSRSVDSFGQINDAFGLITSVEVVSRPPIEEVLDYLGESGVLDYEKSEESGAAIYTMSNDGPLTGTIVLTSNRLTMLPRRQARELRAVMLTGDADPMEQFREEVSQALFDQPDFSGIAIDMDETLNGPIGSQLVGEFPSRYRTVVNLFDEFTMSWRYENGFRLNTALRFNEAPVTPPE